MLTCTFCNPAPPVSAAVPLIVPVQPVALYHVPFTGKPITWWRDGVVAEGHGRGGHLRFVRIVHSPRVYRVSRGISSWPPPGVGPTARPPVVSSHVSLVALNPLPSQYFPSDPRRMLTCTFCNPAPPASAAVPLIVPVQPVALYHESFTGKVITLVGAVVL